VAIPIARQRVLIAWYLTPHPAVDREIASNHWRVFHIAGGKDLSGGCRRLQSPILVRDSAEHRADR